jgi:hypothetical protein
LGDIAELIRKDISQSGDYDIPSFRSARRNAFAGNPARRTTGKFPARAE